MITEGRLQHRDTATGEVTDIGRVVKAVTDDPIVDYRELELRVSADIAQAVVSVTVEGWAYDALRELLAQEARTARHTYPGAGDPHNRSSKHAQARRARAKARR